MTRFWHQNADLVDRLAAEYALGTMPARARRRFDAVMRQRADLQRAVWQWHERLQPTLLTGPEAKVPPRLWASIEQRLDAGREPAAVPAWRRWLAGWSASALVPAALGLMLGLAVLPTWQALHPQEEGGSQLPESYVGVLSTADGKTGLIVSSLRRGHVVDLKRVTPVPLAAGLALVLWTLDAAGRARAVGVVPDGPFVSIKLPQDSETLFSGAVELAVSVERQGAVPAQPSAAFVYRGLCGKLWRVKG